MGGVELRAGYFLMLCVSMCECDRDSLAMG